MDKARSFPYDEGRKDGMPMEIGAKLRQARIAAGLTQEQTAEALGVSRQSISNWENEKNYPDIVSVVRLSDLYAVSLDALLKEEAPMSDYLDYLEESTNTVRSRREQSLLILLCVYLGIWAVSVLFFWLQLILVMSRAAKLYLLDEPIGGVDPATRDYILRTIIGNYNEDASVVISTHLIADVEQVLDEVIFLQNGRVERHTTVDAIRGETGKSVDELFREVFKC